jgi:hypothetical protein
MHALFALYEPQVELINTIFSTIFRDFCRVIDEQWDMLVECIETGSIPDSVDVGHLKDQLLVSYISCEIRETLTQHVLDQKFLPPSPGRAAELRNIPRNVQSPGWLTKIWPGLQIIVAISSGPFQTVVPEVSS